MPEPAAAAGDTQRMDSVKEDFVAWKSTMAVGVAPTRVVTAKGKGWGRSGALSDPLVTRQGDAPDPLLQRGVSTTVVTPLDPPNIGNAPGYNVVGSQGFVHEAAAVQDALSKGLLEHPEMPLDETLAMARVFEKIRAQIGLTYPWDEGEGAAKKARR